jgi:hypothetical protein
VNGHLTHRQRAVMLALLTATIVIVYAPVFQADFLNWDDDVLLVKNTAVTSPNGLAQIWSTIELPAHFPNYPLVFTSYWLEHQLWGLDPAAFHLVSVALHALNAIVVCLLAQALGLAAAPALFVAALFALHPVQAESVAWVAERKNLLSTLFSLLTLLAYVRYRHSGRTRWWVIGLAAFVAALLSKTTAVVLPLSLALADRVYFRRTLGEVARTVAPFFALAALAAAVTVAVENHPPSTPLLERPLLAAACVWFYATKLVAPLGLTPLYPRWDVSSGALFWWLALCGMVVALVAVGRWVRSPHVRWGLGHFAITLLPVIGLVPYGFNEMSFVADHHLYWAAVGMFLALTATVYPYLAQIRSTELRGVVVLVLVALAVMTATYVPVWRNAETLWTAVLERNPSAWVAYNNLGLTYIEQGRLSEATRLLETALTLKQDYPEAHNNLALASYRSGAFTTAAEHCRAAASLKPDEALYHRNLGLALIAAGDAAGAEAALRRSVALAPNASVELMLTRLRAP